MSRYTASTQVYIDLLDIWCFIARDNREAADRVEAEFYELFETLVRMPRMGHTRHEDLPE